MQSGKTGGPKWDSLRIAQKLQNPLLEKLDQTRATTAAAEKVAEGVVLEIEDASVLQTLAKSQQGDASLHTVKAWEQRFAMRRAPSVRDALHAWWSIVVRTISSRFKEGEEVFVDEGTYMRLYRLVFQALAWMEGEDYDEAEADECGAADWESDSVNNMMSRNVFLDSIFQIADLYSALAEHAKIALSERVPLSQSHLLCARTLASDSLHWCTLPRAAPSVDPESVSNFLDELLELCTPAGGVFWIDEPSRPPTPPEPPPPPPPKPTPPPPPPPKPPSPTPPEPEPEPPPRSPTPPPPPRPATPRSPPPSPTPPRRREPPPPAPKFNRPEVPTPAPPPVRKRTTKGVPRYFPETQDQLRGHTSWCLHHKERKPEPKPLVAMPSMRAPRREFAGGMAMLPPCRPLQSAESAVLERILATSHPVAGEQAHKRQGQS